MKPSPRSETWRYAGLDLIVPRQIGQSARPTFGASSHGRESFPTPQRAD